MNFWSSAIVLFGVVCSVHGDLKAIDYEDPGSCDSSNHAEELLVKDREGNEKFLVCTKSNGIYLWRMIDGENSAGEFFDPGYDCSDVLDKNPEAENGFYWIQFDTSVPKKVYCDMITDGGGFMLIGRKNDTIIWTVPSKDETVDPRSSRHWSSALGDAPILDFRIQMASSADRLKDTKAHWSFRLQSKRLLKNLMMVDQGGCSIHTPGIGNISYVKDLQTENIVNTNFRCSAFGGYYHPITKFGWSMMNSCLQSPCKNGFAFHDLYPIQTDFSGSFSYRASGNSSGVTHDSTAFVGCDKGTCCACYGPIGGTGNYCGIKCQSKNGGTVTKNIHSWFWVRSTLPKRVWNKCMEYTVNEHNGDIVWYTLTSGSNVPEKGRRCPQDEALLNDGIVVVPDDRTSLKIPPVPGLMQYRKDNKKLYVRANKTWSVVAQEKKILQKTSDMVKPQLDKFEIKLEEQKQEILQNTSDMVKPRLDKFEKKLEDQKQQMTNVLNTDLSRLETRLGNLNQSLDNIISSLSGDFSSILLGKPYFHLQVVQWLGFQNTWRLCYRASRDGWQASAFHARCDNKGATVTIIRVGIYIFGGYTDVSWDSSSGFKSSSSSFIFSLRNKDNLQPFKVSIKSSLTSYAIYCNSGYGPTFGYGWDIYIADNAHTSTSSYTNIGYYYEAPPGYNVGSSNTQALLAGSYQFTPSEVEVFSFS